jgi:hypothetical protein
MNQRLPYMPHNWLSHASRTSRLTREQRGLMDEVRTELWQVVGVRMLRADLLDRLNIAEGAPDAEMLDVLIRRGNLTQDDAGWVFDQVLTHEWNEALRKADINRQNGAKGGRRKAAPSASAPKTSARIEGDDPEDF